jgi:hypothetical protein
MWHSTITLKNGEDLIARAEGKGNTRIEAANEAMHELRWNLLHTDNAQTRLEFPLLNDTITTTTVYR